jgi:hypothetical protein
MYAKEESIGYLAPLRSLVQSDGVLEVFSTNYDTCVELMCEQLRLVWADGFSVRWDPDVFKRKNVQVCLRKLHGSVLWFEDEAGNAFRSLVGGPKTAAALSEWFGGTCGPFLLYPARKSGYAAPYVDNLTALAESLGKSDKLIVLVVVGYSFRDEALVKVVSDAARRNRQLTVVLVDPNAETIYRERLESIGGDAGFPAPLKDRVIPYGFGLDRPGEVTRRLVREIVDRAAEAHRLERELFEGDSRGSYAWFQAAQACMTASSLRGYWRCVRHSDAHVLGTSFGEAIHRLFDECRLIVAFGAALPENRSLRSFIHLMLVYWIGEVSVARAEGVLPAVFELRFKVEARSEPDLSGLIACFNQSADKCKVDEEFLESVGARRDDLGKLGDVIRRMARALSVCRTATGSYRTSADGLTAAVSVLGSAGAIPGSSDSDAVAEWATRIVQLYIARCESDIVEIVERAGGVVV